MRVALVPDGGDGPNRTVVLLGAPFVLVALGLLWWTWSSARALRSGRREGWTVLLALGGVAVAQTVMTAPGIVSASGSATGSGPPREVVGGMLAMIVLGVVTLDRRRARPPRVDRRGRRACVGRATRPTSRGARRRSASATRADRRLALASRRRHRRAGTPVDDERRAEDDGETDELPAPERSPSTKTPSSTDTTGMR